MSVRATGIRFVEGCGLVLLVGLLATALLAPLGSGSVLPNLPDLAPHLGLLVQARMAIQEGQFPLRVAPWQDNGWGYAGFQYYGQFPDTVGGLVYLYLTPDNPYLALLALFWVSLALAGLGMYAACRRITHDRAAALVGGVAYMTAPYLLVNIHARGDLPEVLAQGVLPLVFLSCVACYEKLSPWRVLAGALAWFVLATTHAVTFIYGAAFLGIFFLVVVCFDRQVMGLVRMAVPAAAGVLLASYYLVPIALGNDLRIHQQLTDPFQAGWLTPLPSLLSPTSVPPGPQPGVGVLPANLHPAIGWALLVGWLIIGWRLIVRREPYALPAGQTIPVGRLAWIAWVLFALAVFLAWSPIDFWPLLPALLQVAQFPYRLLAQVDWLGAVLVAIAFVLLVKDTSRELAAVAVVTLIAFMSSSYLPQLASLPTPLSEIVRQPDIGYGGNDYLYVRPSPAVYARQELPLYSADGWLLAGQTVELPAAVLDLKPVVHVQGAVPSDWFGSAGVTVRAMLGSELIAQRHLSDGPFSWDFPIDVAPALEQQPLWFDTDRSQVPAELSPQSSDHRHLAVRVDSLHLAGLPPEHSLLPVPKVQSGFAREGDAIEGDLTVPADVAVSQLPVLYYPDLLQVQVDGRATSYAPTGYRDYLLVGLRLTPGPHHVTARFVGLGWANALSVATAVGLLGVVLGWAGLRSARLRRLPAFGLRPRPMTSPSVTLDLRLVRARYDLIPWSRRGKFRKEVRDAT